jgi:amidase
MQSATQLAIALRTRQISAVEVVTACLDQIEQHNDRLKALITVCGDRALAEAQAADAAIARGDSLGPLHGIPFTAKDLTPTAGVRTTLGSRLYAHQVPAEDELCIARLRQAGAILMGKTNTPEFGMGAHCLNPLYGPTANPYDPARSSGGSSGGAAVSVATGMAYLAQGTDMGGSVRTPASFCNVVGLRPSMGRIPRPRRQLLWDYLDTDGMLARTVDDVALMLSVMAGEDWRVPISLGTGAWTFPDLSTPTPESRLQNVRIGTSVDLGIADIDHEVAAGFEAAIAQLTPYCDAIAPSHPDCALAPATFETIRAARLWFNLQDTHARYADQLTDTVRWNIERGQNITATALLQAEADRDRLYLNFLDFFEQYDVLITPSASVLPFRHDQGEILDINGRPQHTIIDYLKITYTISLTGLPAISIPCGWSASGLPIGLQVIGKPRGEHDLLSIAAACQAIFS